MVPILVSFSISSAGIILGCETRKIFKYACKHFSLKRNMEGKPTLMITAEGDDSLEYRLDADNTAGIVVTFSYSNHKYSHVTGECVKLYRAYLKCQRFEFFKRFTMGSTFKMTLRKIHPLGREFNSLS